MRLPRDMSGTAARMQYTTPAGRLPGWARRAPVYGMGSLAGYWFLERALGLVW